MFSLLQGAPGQAGMPGPPGPQGAAVSDPPAHFIVGRHMQIGPSVNACCHSGHVGGQFVLLQTQTGETNAAAAVNLGVFCFLGAVPG